MVILPVLPPAQATSIFDVVTAGNAFTVTKAVTAVVQPPVVTEYVTVLEPAIAFAVIRPVPLTVKREVLLLLQVPPAVASLNGVVARAQTLSVPVIPATVVDDIVTGNVTTDAQPLLVV